MARSIKVAHKHIKKVKAALPRNRFSSQGELAISLQISRETVHKFLNGKPIDKDYFIKICEELGLNIDEIADFGIEEDDIAEPPVRTDSVEKRFLSHAGISDTQSTDYETDLLPLQMSPLVFELMLQIDFKEQSRLFKQVINLHQAAGFLIHGDFDCGQQFLVNRLWRLKPGWQNKSPIKIDVTHNAAYRSCERLWKQLYTWFHLSNYAQESDIIDMICNRLQTEDIIFIFDKIDCMPAGVLAAWLQEFWEPLVAMAKENKPKRETHLLMFLVDNCGKICQSNIKFAEELEHPEYPCIPLGLPAVSLFQLDALDEWLDMAILFRDIQFPNGLTSQILLEKSKNGVPQYVYEEICKLLGISWEGDLAKWLI